MNLVLTPNWWPLVWSCFSLVCLLLPSGWIGLFLRVLCVPPIYPFKATLRMLTSCVMLVTECLLPTMNLIVVVPHLLANVSCADFTAGLLYSLGICETRFISY